MSAHPIPDSFAVRDTLFLENEWVPATGDRWLQVVDPSTEEHVARVREPGPADVDRVVAAARRAFDASPWPWTAPEERAGALEALADGIERHAELLTTLTLAERGVPVAQAPAFARMAAASLRQFAAMGRELAFVTEHTRGDGGRTRVVQEPVGVVAAISPWNGPLPAAMLKLGPALAAGCTVILKASPTTPLATYAFGDIVREAGIPPGVIGIIAAEREVSEALVAHPGVDKVAFTGSSRTGKRILELCARRVARASLELGGKSAAIVCDDCDLDAIIDSLVLGGIRSTGQACWANTRVLVSRRRHDEVVERMKLAYEAVRVGSAHEPETEMGPIALEPQLRKIEHYVDVGRDEGARLVTGGRRPEDLDRGWFIAPTLFDRVDNGMRLARDEIFGPVVGVIPYATDEEAIAIANDTRYGLSGSIYTGDVERGFALARRIRTGTLSINGTVRDHGLPSGGFKESGLGPRGGLEGFLSYLEPKSVHLPAG